VASRREDELRRVLREEIDKETERQAILSGRRGVFVRSGVCLFGGFSVVQAILSGRRGAFVRSGVSCAASPSAR